MKKIAFFVVILIITFGYSSSMVIADGTSSSITSQDYKVSLDYAKAAKELEQGNIEASTNNLFAKNSFDLSNSSLFLNLTKSKTEDTRKTQSSEEQKDFYSFEATGSLEIDGHEYDFFYEGDLEKNGDADNNYFHGPLKGHVIIDEKSIFSMMGLYFDSETEETISTITIGELGDSEILSMLHFGDLSDKAKKNIDDLNVSESSFEKVEPTEIDEEELNISESDVGPFLHFASLNTGNLQEEEGGHGNIGTLDTFMRADWQKIKKSEAVTSSFQVRARIFSNTPLLEDYFDDYFGVDGQTNSWVTGASVRLNTSDNINIRDVHPEEEAEVIGENAWMLHFVTDRFPPIAAPVRILSNIYLPMEFPVIEHTYNVRGGNVVDYEVEVHESFEKSIDYTEEELTRNVETFDKSGGFNVYFNYDILGGINTTYLRGSQHVYYGVSSLPHYHGYFRTGAMTTRHNIDLEDLDF